MLKHIITLLLGINVLFGASFAKTEHAKVELISEYKQVKKGETFWIGIKFNLIPHWHIYWKNPGDSGQAVNVSLTLPDEYTKQEMKWPTPNRIPYGFAINYGYENQVIFPIPITAKDLSSQTTLKAKINWLVCKKACVPENASLEFNLPKVGDKNIVNVENQKLIQETISKLPMPLSENPEISFVDGKIKLLIKENWAKQSIKDLWFASDEWGIVAASEKQSYTFTKNGIELAVTPGDLFSKDKKVSGVIVLEEKINDGVIKRGFSTTKPQSTSTTPPLTLLVAIASAFLGGIILNLMPCVLPVLTIKVLSFVKEAKSSKKILTLHGLSFTLGVILSFLALAGILLALRAGGEALGWGFQLQSPLFVTVLALLMLLIGLNLSGVFEVGQGLQHLGQNKHTKTSFLSSFASGVLAVNIASPCTAPFMGVALGYAITQSVSITLLVFFALGVGFALPVLLFSLFPSWLKILPKPGNWMINLRQIFAFPMYATVAWLVWVVAQQTSSMGLAIVFTAIVLIGFASWAYGKAQFAQINPKFGKSLAFIVLLLALGILSFIEAKPSNTQNDDSYKPWSKEQVSKSLGQNKPVFVNFTASWCITCKVNERIAIKTKAVEEAFKLHKIDYLKGDWTNQDSKITKELEKYGRSGVPLYLLFIPGQSEPKILPQVLTEGIILQELENIQTL